MTFCKFIAFTIVIVAVSVQLTIYLLSEKPLTYKFDGHVDKGFESVMEMFKQNFQNGNDKEGAAFAACYKGKVVVDIWGGYADSAANYHWEKDTLTTMYSVTKAISALSIAVLVDRGYLKYNDLMTNYWPEFGKNGKSNATIKMMVSHELGLAALDEPITFELIKDWKLMSKALENQKPNWPVGTAAGYHTLTYGWPIDQIIRRVDPKHRSLGQFFREEIAEPNGIDVFIGLPRHLNYRVARLKRSGLKELLSTIDWELIKAMYQFYGQGPDALGTRTFTNPDWIEGTRGENVFNHPEMYTVEMGGANGIGNARAVAKLFCLLNDETLIKKSTLQQLLKPVYVDSVDKTFNMKLPWGWGFFHSKNRKGNYRIGHIGYGGQYIRYDPDYKLSLAYFHNWLTPPDMTMDNTPLENALYDVLDKMRN